MYLQELIALSLLPAAGPQVPYTDAIRSQQKECDTSEASVPLVSSSAATSSDSGDEEYRPSSRGGWCGRENQQEFFKQPVARHRGLHLVTAGRYVFTVSVARSTCRECSQEQMSWPSWSKKICQREKRRSSESKQAAGTDRAAVHIRPPQHVGIVAAL